MPVPVKSGLNMEDKVPSGRGELTPVEFLPASVEARNSLLKLGDGTALNEIHCVAGAVG